MRNTINKLSHALKQIQQLPTDEDTITREKKKGELNDLLEKEEAYWLQRSRTEWLRDGDKNTTFFHAQVSQRKRRNNIKGLMDGEGNWCE